MPLTMVGHRGAMGVEPENTMRSFDRAAHDGADEIELDVRVSSDGELVVLHDVDVDRTTDGHGPVAALSLAEIRELDAGRGERVPTFEDVLRGVPTALQVEIKDGAAVAATAAMIRDWRRTEQVTVTCADPAVLGEVARTFPEVRRGLILGDCPADAVDRAHAVGAHDVMVGLAGLTATRVAAYHEKGGRVCAWPVNTEHQVRMVTEMGADSATSDFPHLARFRDTLS